MRGFPEVKTQYPDFSEIKKYIDCYYFLNSQDEKGCLDFWHYPHYKSSFVIFKNAAMEAEGKTNFFTSTIKNKYLCICNNNFRNARREIVVGSYDIVGIVLKPNCSKFFQQLILKNSKYLSESKLDEIFKANSLLHRTKLLDAFLDDILQDYEIPPALEKAVAILIKRKGDVYLSELEIQLNVSRRNLLRQFNDYLGCSFREFKSVLKFRIALKKGSKSKTRLIDLAYDSNCFDQSDFIKAFKSKSNETPKKLLKNIMPISEELLWKL